MGTLNQGLRSWIEYRYKLMVYCIRINNTKCNILANIEYISRKYSIGNIKTDIIGPIMYRIPQSPI